MAGWRLTFLSVSLVLAAWLLESLRDVSPPIVNYDGSFFFDPDKLLQPSSEDEVITVINQARASGRRLRVLGSGHSWSPIAVSQDMLVSLNKMSGVVSVDKKRKLVTVRGGTVLNEVVSELHKHDLALSNLPSISAQTVAGLIVTGTHGTGVQSGNLATFVTSMRLISGMGEVVLVSPESDPELFNAAVVSLGMLGVITEVTLQCEDTFLLEETTVNHPIDYCVSHYDELAHSAEFVKFWMEPNSKVCHVYLSNKTTKSPQNNRYRLVRNTEMFLFSIVQSIVSHLSTRVGQNMMRLLVGTGQVFKPSTRVDYSWNVFNLPHYIPSHFEAEIAVDYKHCDRALSELLNYAVNTTVNSVIEVRFVKQDNLWLSPNYHRDSCHVTQLLVSPSPQDVHSYFHSYHRAMFQQYHSRPHWGKETVLNLQQAELLYPKLREFLTIRKRLDPHNVLLNDMTTRLFEL